MPAFNMIGSIDITDQDSHYVVNLEFHDTSRRRPFHFQDHSKFEMAALGSKGAIFASLPSSASSSSLSTSHPAVIHYRPFDAWSSSAEWNYDLPSGEAPVAVAVGGESAESSSSSSRGRDDETGMVVIATDKGYLRFLTGSGVQRYLWKMGEEVISIVGGVEEVFVVHREGGTSLDGKLLVCSIWTRISCSGLRG
jgi:chromosome transmission fidelity protein 4